MELLDRAAWPRSCTKLSPSQRGPESKYNMSASYFLLPTSCFPAPYFLLGWISVFRKSTERPLPFSLCCPPVHSQPGANQAPSQEEQEAISAPVVLPNPFLEQAVAGFADALHQYQGCIAELERAMASIMQQRPRGGGGGGNGIGGFADEASLQQQLPVIISHMHDYFTHVAAQLEKLHSEVGALQSVVQTRVRSPVDMFACGV